MPKITKNDGASDQLTPDYFEEREDECLGNNSSKSDDSTELSEKNESEKNRSTAPNTGGRSKQAKTAHSPASSGDTSSKAGK